VEEFTASHCECMLFVIDAQTNSLKLLQIVEHMASGAQVTVCFTDPHMSNAPTPYRFSQRSKERHNIRLYLQTIAAQYGCFYSSMLHTALGNCIDQVLERVYMY
jgi:hypothetical protein